MAESGEVGAEASGQASARDSACSKEGRAVELLDTVARRGDDGERELHGGAGAAASATTPTNPARSDDAHTAAPGAKVAHSIARMGPQNGRDSWLNWALLPTPSSM